MLRALEWIKACFGVETHFSAVFVRSQVSGSSSAAGDRPSPKPARMATVEMLVCLEEFVFCAPSSILQCWAGVQVALGHGVLSKDLTLTDDALMGITCRMKKLRFTLQKKVRPHTSLKTGYGVFKFRGLLQNFCSFLQLPKLLRTSLHLRPTAIQAKLRMIEFLLHVVERTLQRDVVRLQLANLLVLLGTPPIFCRLSELLRLVRFSLQLCGFLRWRRFFFLTVFSSFIKLFLYMNQSLLRQRVSFQSFLRHT